MTTSNLRFGVWAVVCGARAAHQDPEEPYDASWERNRDLVLAAEELGYDSTLIAQHTINPHQEDLDQPEAWSAAAAIAALTSRIEIIAAFGRTRTAGHGDARSALLTAKGWRNGHCFVSRWLARPWTVTTMRLLESVMEASSGRDVGNDHRFQCL